MGVDEGAGDGELDAIGVAHTHYLDVLADLGETFDRSAGVETIRNRQHRLLERRQRRESHPARAVVGERHPGLGLAHEEIDEIARSRTHQAAHPNMSSRIEGMEIGGQPLFARLRSKVLYGHLVAAVLEGGASGQIDLHRGDDTAAAECRSAAARPQQRLVDVMMKDEVKMLQIISAQRKAQLFGKRVTHGVRMADSLALDDLDGAIRRGGILTNNEFHWIWPSVV